MEQQVKVRIRSRITQYDVSESGQIKASNGAKEDTIEYVVEGRMESRGDLLTVTYREMEQMGLGKVETSVVLRVSNPNRVTILRKGEKNGSMVFDAEKQRTFCTYDTGVMPMELCLFTRKIENSVKEESGGLLKLDYDIELQGMKAQRTRLSMEVEKARADR
ncbi:MAG: DUF1934 domain-containing protein [Ruminococcaceae bacterium]|nr:DUF1934 domain-containing protein [Oscillospiraceae bacterium]